jgi:hypothetical protein
MATMLVVPRQPLLLLLKKHSLNNHFHKKKVIRNERTSSFNYKSIANVPLKELPGVYISKILSLPYPHFPIQTTFSNTFFLIIFVGFL